MASRVGEEVEVELRVDPSWALEPVPNAGDEPSLADLSDWQLMIAISNSSKAINFGSCACTAAPIFAHRRYIVLG